MNLSQLVGANDNEIGGNSVAPNFTICNLIPGNSYFILFDGFNSTTGNYSISLSEIILNAGSTGSQLDVCYSDTVNLFNGILHYDVHLLIVLELIWNYLILLSLFGLK
jgi:hypothetical protein